MASSTKIPIEKISANKDTRFNVKPQAHEKNNVIARVTTTAKPTIKACRQPKASRINNTTEPVANSNLVIRVFDLSAAVRP